MPVEVLKTASRTIFGEVESAGDGIKRDSNYRSDVDGG